MKHSLHHDGNILRGFSCVRWALRDFTFRPLITFKKPVGTSFQSAYSFVYSFNRLNSQLLIKQVKNLKAKKKEVVDLYKVVLGVPEFSLTFVPPAFKTSIYK